MLWLIEKASAKDSKHKGESSETVKNNVLEILQKAKVWKVLNDYLNFNFDYNLRMILISLLVLMMTRIMMREKAGKCVYHHMIQKMIYQQKLREK